ncbi:MAG: hypothetical protein JO180_05855 [Gemmatirosa sp.]|nr:hypothetical protein [Gemmatirosa sp.]
MRRLGLGIMVVATLATAPLAGCLHVGPAPARVGPGGCDPALEARVLHAARNAVADRQHLDRFRLPWTDTLPPAVVHDAARCRAAAVAYAGGRLPRGVEARAAVVRAGGLYFVVGPVRPAAGEALMVGVLDAAFRWIIGIAS